MNKLSKDEAQKLVEPYAEDIRESFTDSWATYRSDKYGEVRHLHSSRTRANIVYDHIVDNLRNRLDGSPGLHFLNRQGLLLLGIKSKILMKFKKLTKRKLSRTYPTRQARAIDRQVVLPGFPPEASYVVAGYQLDDLQAELNDVLVTYPYDNQLRWDFSLMPARKDAIAMPELLTKHAPEDPLKSPKSDVDKGKQQK